MQILKQNKTLAWILVLSFLLPLIYSFYFRIHPVVDAQAYDVIAVNIVDGFGFREDSSLSYEWDNAIVRAGPGYEYFLAGVYKIFGHHYEVVWIIQALLHTVSVWLIYLIALRVFSNIELDEKKDIRKRFLAMLGMTGEGAKNIALISAALFAFWPDLIEISAMLMTETLYLFFTVLTLFLFVKVYEDHKNICLALVSGLITGLAVLTRPPILLFIPIFLFLYIQKKSYKAGAVFLFAALAALSPWVIRNYLIYNQLIITTMIGEFNIWVGNTLQADGGQLADGYNPLREYVNENGFFGLKEKAGMEFKMFLLNHPFVFIKLTFLRFIRFFSLIRPMGFWFYQSGLGEGAVVFSSLVWIAGVFLAGFSGLVELLKKKKTIFYYLAVMAATSPLVLLPTVVQSRYRFQIYPFLVLFAGYMIYKSMQNKKWYKEKSLLYTFSFLILVSLLDFFINFGTVLDRLTRVL